MKGSIFRPFACIGRFTWRALACVFRFLWLALVFIFRILWRAVFWTCRFICRAILWTCRFVWNSIVFICRLIWLVLAWIFRALWKSTAWIFRGIGRMFAPLRRYCDRRWRLGGYGKRSRRFRRFSRAKRFARVRRSIGFYRFSCVFCLVALLIGANLAFEYFSENPLFSSDGESSYNSSNYVVESNKYSNDDDYSLESSRNEHNANDYERSITKRDSSDSYSSSRQDSFNDSSSSRTSSSSAFDVEPQSISIIEDSNDNSSRNIDGIEPAEQTPLAPSLNSDEDRPGMVVKNTRPEARMIEDSNDNSPRLVQDLPSSFSSSSPELPPSEELELGPSAELSYGTSTDISDSLAPDTNVSLVDTDPDFGHYNNEGFLSLSSAEDSVSSHQSESLALDSSDLNSQSLSSAEDLTSSHQFESAALLANSSLTSAVDGTPESPAILSNNISTTVLDALANAIPPATRVDPLPVDGSEFLLSNSESSTSQSENNASVKVARQSEAVEETLFPLHRLNDVAMESLEGGEGFEEIIDGTSFVFRYCPPGTFKMGAPLGERIRMNESSREDFELQHCVELSQGFWMLETETTQKLWQAVMGWNYSRHKGEDLPVENVSWNDCQEFVSRLNAMGVAPKGWRFSLPTEAQWEYACRAGTNSRFAFGDSLEGKANFASGDTENQTRPVKSYQANNWNLFDMHGNVAELCLDNFDQYSEEKQLDPVSKETRRLSYVCRGGGERSGENWCRSACRRSVGAFSFDSQGRSAKDLEIDLTLGDQQVPSLGCRIVLVQDADALVDSSSPEPVSEPSSSMTSPAFSSPVDENSIIAPQTLVSAIDKEIELAPEEASTDEQTNDVSDSNDADTAGEPQIDESALVATSADATDASVVESQVDEEEILEEYAYEVDSTVAEAPEQEALANESVDETNATPVIVLEEEEEILEEYAYETNAPSEAQVAQVDELSVDVAEETTVVVSETSDVVVASPVASVESDADTDESSDTVAESPVEPQSWNGGQAGDGRSLTICGVETVFRYCPPGSFTMGSPVNEEGRDGDEPQHQVTLTKGFLMMETEATRKMWKAAMGWDWNLGIVEDFERNVAEDNLPVQGIPWECCQLFIDKMNSMGIAPKGWRFALPTEAQWEYACRAGTTTPFAFGVSLNGCANYRTYDGHNTPPVSVFPVKQYRSNKWNLYDMHGNVMEWCRDLYRAYSKEEQINPCFKNIAEVFHVIRGGSYGENDRFCRSAWRRWGLPYGNNLYGFRAILEPCSLTESETQISETAENPLPTDENSVGGEEWKQTIQGVETVFRYCPSGTFTMGSPESEVGRIDPETPHQVTLSEGFWLLETETTRQLWQAVMGTETSMDLFSEDSETMTPVTNVSWYDCQKFISKLNSSKIAPEGWVFSLPTEAQWEYACRAGTTTPYAFGDSLKERIWKDLSEENDNNGGVNSVPPVFTEPSNGNTARESIPPKEMEDSSKVVKRVAQDALLANELYSGFKPVKSYRANNWNLYEMHGNALEWCLDVLRPYTKEAQTDPCVLENKEENENDQKRVVRGGCSGYGALDLRSASRGAFGPSDTDRELGFRLALVRPSLTSDNAVPTSFDFWKGRQAGEGRSLTIYGVDAVFRYCPPGTFTMGSPADERRHLDVEKQRQVTLTQSFLMTETEVTQQLWKAVMGTDPSKVKGDDLPVANVSWQDCQDFVDKLNDLKAAPKGWKYALPTEAQWEYACRAGTTTPYPFGDSLEERANFDSAEIKPVKSYEANKWNLYDMCGNVGEWCSDFAQTQIYNCALTDPLAEASENAFSKILRGGCYKDSSEACRSAARAEGAIYESNQDAGFRIVLVRQGQNDSDSRLVVKLPEPPVMPDCEKNMGGEEWRASLCGVESIFRYCPPGTFTMGDALRNDNPEHLVRLTKGFWILETEATQKLWKSVMGKNPSIGLGDDLPVNNISWCDCQEFVAKLNAQNMAPEGWKFTLPTEAQWEYACRAGSKGPFTFGNTLDSLANFDSYEMKPAGSYSPNGWNIYDMHGNVEEWCLDEYVFNISVEYLRNTIGSRSIDSPAIISIPREPSDNAPSQMQVVPSTGMGRGIETTQKDNSVMYDVEQATGMLSAPVAYRYSQSPAEMSSGNAIVIRREPEVVGSQNNASSETLIDPWFVCEYEAPKTHNNGFTPILRGGSYLKSAGECASAKRSRGGLTSTKTTGFRPVLVRLNDAPRGANAMSTTPDGENNPSDGEPAVITGNSGTVGGRSGYAGM